MLDFLMQRRTIRKYTNAPVAPEIINDLLLAAAQSSNTGNMQAYSVVVTTDAKLRKALAPAHFNQTMITDAPVVLTFCADFNRFSQWCRQRDATPGYNNFQSFMAAAIDAVIFAQTFAIAAEHIGLGICYLGTTTYNAQEIISALELPQLVVPVTSLTVGYPEIKPPLTDRLPMAAVVHQQKYTPFSEEEVNELYLEKEAHPVYQNFTKENNKTTLAQVFTEVRYTQKNNEFFSEKFLNALQQQGFM